MSIQLAPDVEQLVLAQLRCGRYSNENDVLRAAMKALSERDEVVAAIAEGLADADADRIRPARAVEADLRDKHAFGT